MKRSHVEKQLYDATKYLYRPSENELAAIVSGDPIKQPKSERIDVVFEPEGTDDAV